MLDSSFETLLFTFKGKKLKALSFKDKIGQTTSVIFKKVELNVEIADRAFDFIPPAGTDIIVNE